MPFGDRTGPMGMGAMTGRRAGYCTGNAYMGRASSFGGRGMGRGVGRGHGMGRGMGRYYCHTDTPYTLSKEEENKLLKDEISYAEKGIENMKKRLSELESDD